MEMKEDGFTIGSHTVFHSDLTKKKDDESEQDFLNRIENELRESKRVIDKKLNQDTLWLAYPYGRYDQRVMKFSREAGYKLAVSVKRGGNPFFGNPLSIKRDQILSRDLDKFASRLKIFNHLPLE
jgi:peptidoglycan/xylan/chitin deacetylase (PgdA/CDA1 family)